jgi:hypothetical protein
MILMLLSNIMFEDGHEVFLILYKKYIDVLLNGIYSINYKK